MHLVESRKFFLQGRYIVSSVPLEEHKKVGVKTKINDTFAKNQNQTTTIHFKNSKRRRTHDQTVSQVEHTTTLFLRSNTRPHSFLGRTHDQTVSKIEHATTLFLGSNTRPHSFSGRTHDHTLSQVEHTTKLFLRSNTRPHSFSGRTHGRTISQVEHTTKLYLGSNTRPNSL